MVVFVLFSETVFFSTLSLIKLWFSPDPKTCVWKGALCKITRERGWVWSPAGQPGPCTLLICDLQSGLSSAWSHDLCTPIPWRSLVSIVHDHILLFHCFSSFSVVYLWFGPSCGKPVGIRVCRLLLQHRVQASAFHSKQTNYLLMIAVKGIAII